MAMPPNPEDLNTISRIFLLSIGFLFFFMIWLFSPYKQIPKYRVATFPIQDNFDGLPEFSIFRNGNDLNLDVNLNLRCGREGANYKLKLETIPRMFSIFEDIIKFSNEYNLTFAPRKRFEIAKSVRKIQFSNELGISDITPIVVEIFTDKYNSEIFIRFDSTGAKIPLRTFEQWVVALRSLFAAYSIIPRSE